jgi:hypothetical protein
MADLRSNGPKLIQPLEADNVGKAKDHLSEQITQPEDHSVTKIH